jgi:hypothetical protein
VIVNEVKIYGQKVFICLTKIKTSILHCSLFFFFFFWCLIMSLVFNFSLVQPYSLGFPKKKKKKKKKRVMWMIFVTL